MLSAEVSTSSSAVELINISGPAGQEVIVAANFGGPASSHVRANGMFCGSTSSSTAEVIVRLAGEAVLRAMPISSDKPPYDFAGGWFNTTFIIPDAVKQQLSERDAKYPI